MEEKERYVYHEVSNEVEQYECYYDTEEGYELFDDEDVLNRLNEQDFELKKLNQENIKLIKENQQLKQQLADKEQENERLKEEICKYEITLMDKNSQLKKQLHDLPNKIVEEISKELKSLYKNYPIIYSEDKDIVKSCYDKDSVNTILDTILKKYGVENE